MNTRIDAKEVLRGFDLLGLVERDIPDLAGSFNGRYTREVPCPVCGGRTRLRLRLCDDRIQRLYCERQCTLNGADAIAYLQWRDGVDFKTALGIVAGHTTMTPAPTFTGAPAAQIVDAAPGLDWQATASNLVKWAEEFLWSGAPFANLALAYLRQQRLLTDDTIRAAHLGCNPEFRTRPASKWGLTDRNQVHISRGIVIPRWCNNDLWAVNVRRLNQDGTPAQDGKKYVMVDGSRLGLFGCDRIMAEGVDLAITLGGEFDCLLAQQHATPSIGCVTFGGEGRRLVSPWLDMLNRMISVYVCLDNDAAGDAGAVQWIDVDNARRVRVPTPHKDLTDYARAGGDVTTLINQWLDEESDMEADALAWLESKGYTPAYDAAGHIVAAREDVTVDP